MFYRPGPGGCYVCCVVVDRGRLIFFNAGSFAPTAKEQVTPPLLRTPGAPEIIRGECEVTPNLRCPGPRSITPPAFSGVRPPDFVDGEHEVGRHPFSGLAQA